jgi:hypothetical protein
MRKLREHVLKGSKYKHTSTSMEVLPNSKPLLLKCSQVLSMWSDENKSPLEKIYSPLVIIEQNNLTYLSTRG